MIKSEIRGDVFTTRDRHIIFGVNTEGLNDSGFAGKVSQIWPGLANTGGNSLGDVLEKTVNSITYHAIVCHSLESGWDGAPQVIREALDGMDFEAPASIIMIGSGFIGLISNAPVEEIYEAFRLSNKELNLYLS